VDPAFLTASGEELPGWQKVTSEGAPAASKEVNSRKFGDNVQDTVDVVQGGAVERSAEAGSLGCDEIATSRSSSRHVREGQKQRSFYSRPDMIRWRLFVEGVRTPIDEGPESVRLRRVSQHFQDVILFLESLGLDSTKLMAKYPLLSTCSVENVRAVVRFLESHKLRRRDVVKVLTNNPYLLGHSVDETFRPVVAFLLKEVGLRGKDVGKVVNRCARLLTASVDGQLRPTLRFLKNLGFTHMSIVVSNNATLLASSVENRLIPKMEFLQSLGLSKDEAVQALIRFPAIFNYSIDTNLQPKYSYLVDEMGCGLDDLKAFPQYFGYSLEYRIRPRYQFLKKRNLVVPLAGLLKPTDEVFYARFQHELMRESSGKAPSSVV
jgi:mTERF domain-containing protein